MSFRTYQAVLDHSKQPPTFKFLLTLIASSENEESGRCNPGIEVLAFYHTTLPRSIRKLLLPLVDAGELVIAGRTGHSNQYYIPLYPGEPGYYDPGPCQDTDIHKCNGQHGPILSRTEIAMQNSPRWKAQESRKKEARQSRRSTKRDVLQDRGSGGGVSSRTGGGVLQDRGGVSSRTARIFMEKEMNKK